MCIVSLIPSPLSLVVCDLFFRFSPRRPRPWAPSLLITTRARSILLAPSRPLSHSTRFYEDEHLRESLLPDILCLPLTPTPATTNAAAPLHHPPPTSHMLYRISSRRTKVVEDISLLSAKLVGFKCCFAKLSLLVSEQIPNVACFKLCPSGGFVSGNRLMTFWH